MCWSLESSKNAYIIGTISSSMLMIFGDNVDKNIGLFFLIVAQMQLIEYFIWKDQSCGEVNNIASKMILPELIGQALAMILGAYLFNSTILSKKTIGQLTFMTTVIGIVASITYVYSVRNEKVCSKKVYNKGIKWDIGTNNVIRQTDAISLLWKVMYYGSLFLFPLLWKSNIKKYIYVVSTITSWLYIQYVNQTTWESRWCYPASLIPSFYLLLMTLDVN